MFRIYIWIDGKAFEPKDFSAKFGGSVETRKRVRKGVTESAGTFWRSQVLKTLQDPEISLRDLLVRERDALLAARGMAGTRVVAEVVEEYPDAESVRGFYFPTDVLKLASDLGVSIDIDLVRKVEGTAE